MSKKEDEPKRCCGNGNIYQKDQLDLGNDVKDGIVYMGFMSRHDLYVYWTPLSDGWYSYKYLDDIIDSGKAEFKGAYKIFGRDPTGTSGVKLYEPKGE